jgi:hypothetical protein
MADGSESIGCCSIVYKSIDVVSIDFPKNTAGIAD